MGRYEELLLTAGGVAPEDLCLDVLLLHGQVQPGLVGGRAPAGVPGGKKSSLWSIGPSMLMWLPELNSAERNAPQARL